MPLRDRYWLAASASAAVVAFATIGAAVAQPKPAAPTAATPAPAAPDVPQQVALTDKQVQGVLDSQSEIADATAKLNDQDSDKIDPKVQAQLDGIAKKHGFADFGDYDKTVTNVSLVLAGFDPQTKKYIGPDNVIKRQIDEVKADKQIPPLDKKKAVDELQASLKQVTPLQYPDNVKVVEKFYDKLSQALQGD